MIIHTKYFKFFFLIVITLMWFLASLANAQIGSSYKLNGELVSGGDVSENSEPASGFTGYQISPDGKTVVYRADQNIDGVVELFSVPIAGGSAVKLNSIKRPLDFEISADSRRVIYLGYQGDSNDFRELFSVPIAGGPEVRLNPDLVENGNVFKFKISSDNTRVVYIADQNTDRIFELFSVPITGGSPIPIGVARDFFQISLDSARVVYQGSTGLSSVPITGGDVIDLNPDRAAIGSARSYQISADSTRVVFLVSTSSSFYSPFSDLISVPIAGGPAVQLNPLRVRFNATGARRDYQISPDSSRVIYTNGQGISTADLFSVPIAGGAAVKLNLESGIYSFEISTDSTWVVYKGAVSGFEEGDALVSVPIAGGDATRIHSTGVSEYKITGNSAQVVFGSTFLADDGFRDPALYSVPIAGGEAVKLVPNPVFSIYPKFTFDSEIQISPDSARVIFNGDARDSLGFTIDPGLFSVPIRGGLGARLSGRLSSLSIDDHEISPDGFYVVYFDDQNRLRKHELFAHQLRGLPTGVMAPSLLLMLEDEN